eukprot:53039_1
MAHKGFCVTTLLITALLSIYASENNDSKVLLDLYYATNGSNWHQPWSISVIENNNYCVQNKSNLHGLQCVNNDIVALYLFNNNLNGFIPSSICTLHKLEALPLSQNSLTCTIPSCIGNLSNLVDLRLFDNYLQGTIPSNLWNLKQLIFLDLSNNQFSGTLSDNVNHLTQLQNYALHRNQLTGSIPTSLCKLNTLQVLGLAYNNLSSTIPSCIGNLSSLHYLVLYNNSLQGIIPLSITHLTLLVELDLRNNLLTGTIPNLISALTQLQELDISNNNIIGTIPKQIHNMSRLQLLSVNDNFLTGRIHAFPPYIQSFIAFNNRFSDDLPVLPKSFRGIVVFGNAFTGRMSNIFHNIKQMRQLSTVILNDNNFYEDDIASLMKDFLSLPNLVTLSLANNHRITGGIPELQNNTINYKQTSLNHLVLHGMDLNGSLPNSIRLMNIKYISLFNNRLACNIPNYFVVSNNLSFERDNYTAMVLSSNSFSCRNMESIPQWISDSKVSLSDVDALYITHMDIIKDWAYIISSFCCLFIALLLKLCMSNKQNHISIPGSRKNALYNTQMDVIFAALNNIKG